jgi:hypothetical protein
MSLTLWMSAAIVRRKRAGVVARDRRDRLRNLPKGEQDRCQYEPNFCYPQPLPTPWLARGAATENPSSRTQTHYSGWLAGKSHGVTLEKRTPIRRRPSLTRSSASLPARHTVSVERSSNLQCLPRARQANRPEPVRFSIASSLDGLPRSRLAFPSPENTAAFIEFLLQAM